MIRLKYVALLASAAALITAAVACSDSSNKPADGSSSASQQSVDELSTRVQQDEMLNAWVTLSAMPLHDLDETLQGGTIDSKYVPTLRAAIRVIALTNFTSDVKPQMDKMHDDAVALLNAMDAGQSVDSLKDMSATLHEDAHGLSALGNSVAKDLPPNAGGPVATATPSNSGGTTSTPTH